MKRTLLAIALFAAIPMVYAMQFTGRGAGQARTQVAQKLRQIETATTQADINRLSAEVEGILNRTPGISQGLRPQLEQAIIQGNMSILRANRSNAQETLTALAKLYNTINQYRQALVGLAMAAQMQNPDGGDLFNFGTSSFNAALANAATYDFAANQAQFTGLYNVISSGVLNLRDLLDALDETTTKQQVANKATYIPLLNGALRNFINGIRATYVTAVTSNGVLNGAKAADGVWFLDNLINPPHLLQDLDDLETAAKDLDLLK